MATDPLEDLLTNMPDEGASEEEIAEFMNQFMGTAGGEDMLKSFASQITEGRRDFFKERGRHSLCV